MGTGDLEAAKVPWSPWWFGNGFTNLRLLLGRFLTMELDALGLVFS